MERSIDGVHLLYRLSEYNHGLWAEFIHDSWFNNALFGSALFVVPLGKLSGCQHVGKRVLPYKISKDRSLSKAPCLLGFVLVRVYGRGNFTMKVRQSDTRTQTVLSCLLSCVILTLYQAHPLTYERYEKAKGIQTHTKRERENDIRRQLTPSIMTPAASNAWIPRMLASMHRRLHRLFARDTRSTRVKTNESHGPFTLFTANHEHHWIGRRNDFELTKAKKTQRTNDLIAILLPP